MQEKAGSSQLHWAHPQDRYAGGSSGKTDLGKEKKQCTVAGGWGGGVWVGMCKKRHYRYQGQRGAAPGTRAELPLQPMEKTVVKLFILLQSMENHVRADIHTAACGGSHAGAGGYALRKLQLAESPRRSRSCMSCCLWRGAHTGARCLAGTVANPCGTQAGAVSFSRERKRGGLFLKPLRRQPSLEQLLKNCFVSHGKV